VAEGLPWRYHIKQTLCSNRDRERERERERERGKEGGSRRAIDEVER